jgi:hypothetical protein
MVSKSFDTSLSDEVGYLHDAPEREHATSAGGLQDDVERLIDIAGELFSAIERQIHRIEVELAFVSGEEDRAHAQIVFKERLIRCAQDLELSIHEIGIHIERRASEHIVNFGLHDISSE